MSQDSQDEITLDEDEVLLLMSSVFSPIEEIKTRALRAVPETLRDRAAEIAESVYYGCYFLIHKGLVERSRGGDQTLYRLTQRGVGARHVLLFQEAQAA